MSDHRERVSIEDQKEYKLLGQGNTAQIYQYAEGKILKLFREQMPFEGIEHEYRLAKIIQKELKNVPRAYKLVKVNDRYGIVYEQIQGVDMITLILKDPIKTKYYAKILARTHQSIHVECSEKFYSVKDKLEHDIDVGEGLTQEEKDAIKKYLHTLPDKHQICHFDYHPGNVMYHGMEPVVIDWMTACTGDANADVARTLLLMKMGEMMHVSEAQRKVIHMIMGIIGKKYFKEYRKLTKVKAEEVNAWMLPVAAARLAEWLTDHERENLIAFVRKELAKIGA